MRELPGFYYDQEKKKYFRLIDGQRRHDGSLVYASTSSGIGSTRTSGPPNQPGRTTNDLDRQSLPALWNRSQTFGSNDSTLEAAHQITRNMLNNLTISRWNNRNGDLVKIRVFPSQNLCFGQFVNARTTSVEIAACSINESFQVKSLEPSTNTDMQVLNAYDEYVHHDFDCTYNPSVHKHVLAQMGSQVMEDSVIDWPQMSKLYVQTVQMIRTPHTGHEVCSKMFSGHSQCVSASVHGDMMAVGQSNRVFLFQIAGGELLELCQFPVLQPTAANIRCMQMLNNNRIVVGSDRGELSMLDYRDPDRCIVRWSPRLRPDCGPITSLVDTQLGSGYQIACSGMRHFLGVTDLRMPNRIVSSFEEHRNANSNTKISVCPEKQLILCPGDDGPIRIWNLVTNRLVTQIPRSRLQVQTDNRMHPFQCVLSDGWKLARAGKDRLGLMIVDRKGLILASSLIDR